MVHEGPVVNRFEPTQLKLQHEKKCLNDFLRVVSNAAHVNQDSLGMVILAVIPVTCAPARNIPVKRMHSVHRLEQEDTSVRYENCRYKVVGLTPNYAQ